MRSYLDLPGGFCPEGKTAPVGLTDLVFRAKGGASGVSISNDEQDK